MARSENQQKQSSISARHQVGSLTQSLYNYNIITQRDIEDAVHLDLIKGLGLLFEGSKSCIHVVFPLEIIRSIE